tara:strand:- start:1532 stop:2029 length:498 start_codon:yes stop_codon:yes gene_type:complete
MDSCGFSQFLNKDNTEDNEKILNKIIVSSILALTTESMVMANTYSSHAKRNVISGEDLTLALKYQCKNFIDSDEFEDKVQTFIDDDTQSNSGSDQDDSDSDSDSDQSQGDHKDEDIFSYSSCTCETCENINNVNSWWDKWEPDDPIKISLKRAVNNAASDNMIDV